MNGRTPHGNFKLHRKTSIHYCIEHKEISIPSNAPAKVLISPNATRTELSMMPTGGTQKPSNRRSTPDRQRNAAMHNCNFIV